MNKIYTFFVVLSCFYIYNFTCLASYQADGAVTGATGLITTQDILENTSASDNLHYSVKNIIDYFLSFLGIICVVMIVYAGLLLITDLGGEENVGKAKNILIWATVGIILILLSYSLAAWVFNVTSVL